MHTTLYHFWVYSSWILLEPHNQISLWQDWNNNKALSLFRLDAVPTTLALGKTCLHEESQPHHQPSKDLREASKMCSAKELGGFTNPICRHFFGDQREWTITSLVCACVAQHGERAQCIMLLGKSLHHVATTLPYLWSLKTMIMCAC